MTETTCFRLLNSASDDKGAILTNQISLLNAEGQSELTFIIDPYQFSAIPGSPFAYWVGDRFRQLYAEPTTLQSLEVSVQHGLSTKHDFRWIRLSWEAPMAQIGTRWFPFAKGGEFARYYSDIYLLVDAQDSFSALEAELLEKYPYLGKNANWVLHRESEYLQPGLTYTRRTTSPFSVRAMPAGCYFSDKGPGCIGPESLLLPLLVLLNSSVFRYCLEMQLGAADAAARSYEVGIVSSIPIPVLPENAKRIASLSIEAHSIRRKPDQRDELAHVFGIPGLVENPVESLLCGGRALDVANEVLQAELAAIYLEVDEITFRLYDLDETDQSLIRAEVGEPSSLPVENGKDDEDEESDDDSANAPSPPRDKTARVQNMLMWCVGVAFGRWDIRMALDSSLLPALQSPFDPLPRCAPGTLVGTDGLPPANAAAIAPEAWLHARHNVLDVPPVPQAGDRTAPVEYPLPIAWDGILVDDENHPSDIVGRVEQVIRLLWGERGDTIIQEACEILGYPDLRSYFRDPRQGFYAFHIKRYSKSRRKAPIYWLLQSEKRNYGIWLYCHRMRDTTLFEAARRPYADSKVLLEEARLGELQQNLESLNGAARRQREREIERQQKVVTDVTAFRSALDKVALLQLPPDHNDGVVISMAPLHALTPWKEPGKLWRQLLAGEYPWSTMSQQMHQRRLVKSS